MKVSDGKCPGQDYSRGAQTLEFTTGFGLGAAVASRVTGELLLLGNSKAFDLLMLLLIEFFT